MTGKIESFLRESIQKRVFTGAAYAMKRGEEVFAVNSIGTLAETKIPVNRDTLFDMASCTKLFVSLAFLRLMEEGRIALTDQVERYLTSWKGYPTGKITMFELLTHTSILPAHILLYRVSSDREGAMEAIRNLPPRQSGGVEYSCLGFIVLGRILEEVTGLSLDRLIDQSVCRPLGMEHTMYCPRQSGYENIMPTQYCQWRDRLLTGEVHDENAFHMGGVSGNAGIFSSITDMCRFAEALSAPGREGSPLLLHKRTLDMMTRNYTKGLNENRGLGWCVKNTPDNTAGEYFSESSFGHTGYTGTSIWIDPENNSYAILLTNRVYYSREVDDIRHVRQVFHNLAMLQ
ncbi:CubicO group peptidase (beta-lactamase class C family) [Anaerotaenia torta]|uniref:serine hydrolase domain-containing protein n=1 Tax=Anaerotaenia torta TaxID=433293 RepID=UPI003D1FD7F7